MKIRPIRLISPIRPILFLSGALGVALVLIGAYSYLHPNKAVAAWWPEIGNNWAERKQLTLTNNSGATLNSTAVVAVSIDTKSLVDSGKLRSDCNDLRIVYHNTSTTATELTRYPVYSSGGTCANSTATKVNFILQANITNGSSDTNYYLYYSNPSASAPSSTDNAFDISSADALLVCPFDGSTTCAGGETPSTSTGALRYSGSKSALSFDKYDDKVALSTQTLPTNFTIELWANINHPASGIDYILGTGGEYAYNIINFNNGASTIQFYYINGGGGLTCGTAFTKQSGSWAHIALTGDSNTVTCYYNGVSRGTASRSSFPTTWNTLGNLYSTGYGFKGLADELRVSNTIRYTSNFTPPTAPFIRDANTTVLLHFDENGSDPRNAGKAIDDSGNGNHGTITGAKYVSGLVGVDASTSDTGYYQTQSYAGHNGIFIEEGTTNKITNPSFDHSTYDTNWDAVGGNLTVTSNTTAPYYKFGSKSAKIVAAGAISGSSNMDTIGIDPDSTSTHTLSAYVYNGTSGAVGGTVDANVAKLVFEGVAQTTTYTDMGGGWWRLTYSAATTDSTNEYGIEVADTKTIYIDGVQLEAKAYATTYTDGTLGTGYAWTGTAHNSTSTRTAAALNYAKLNNVSSSAGTISMWVKPNWSSTSIPGSKMLYNCGSQNSANDTAIYMRSDNILYWETWDGSGNYKRRYKSSANWTNGSWYHVVVTWDGSGNLYLYINNSEAASGDGSGTGIFTPPCTNFDLGSQEGSLIGNTNFHNLNIYDTALSSAQIGDLYNSGLLSHSQGTVLDRFSNNKGEDPVGTWHFDEGQGATTYDSSTSKNNGTISGATWTTEDQCVSGKCLKFDGSDDYISVADSNSTDIGTSDFSISAWIRNNGSSTRLIWDKYDNTAGDGYQFYLSSTNQLKLWLDNTGYGGSSGTQLNDNKWHYVVVTADRDGNAVFYVDGKAEQTVDISAKSATSLATSVAANIGRQRYDSTYIFNGFIDEVKIYPYARSAAQILTDYTSRGSANGISADISSPISENLSNGLVGYWKMDESSWTNDCSTTSVTDSSGNGNNGKACPNSTGPTGGAAGKFGNSGSFDGSTQYASLGHPSLTNWTISTWAKATSLSNARNTVFGFADYGTMNFKIQSTYIEVTADGNSYITSGNLSNTTNLNTWYHYAISCDSTDNKARIFVNGIQLYRGNASPYTCTQLAPSWNDLMVGGGRQTGQYYAGTVDDVRIYNRALSPAEVRQLADFAPGPRVELRMEEGNGTSTNDSSGNSRTGTINGNPLWSNGKYGKGLRLDGTGDNISVGDF